MTGAFEVRSGFEPGPLARTYSFDATTRHQVPPSTFTGWHASLNGQLLKLACIRRTVAWNFACLVNFASTRRGFINSVSYTFVFPHSSLAR